MATLFQRHCNDESLISHLDGELPFYRRARVRRHLEECWQCRLRLSEIEAQVLAVTRAMQEDAFPGPQRIADARLRFLARADAIADEVLERRVRRVRAFGWRGLAWAGACLTLLGAFAAWRLSRSPLAPAEAIQRLERAESQAARLPAHQKFRIVARQLRPQPASRQSRLELWSEPDRGRFMTRFSDARGVLRHALWQPESGRRYVFRASVATTVVRLQRQQVRERWEQVLFRDGLTLEDLEAALLTWIENRSWRPVSLSSGIAYLSADGAALSAEQVRPGVLRLRARKSAGRVTVEFILDVNARTYTPYLQRIRYESPARLLELELEAEPADAAAAAVSFEPPAALLPHPASPAALPPPPVAAAPVPDAALLEIRIFQALHAVRACLGETIGVSARPGGAFEVHGAVVSPERKEEVLAALAPLAGPRLVVDLKSAGEMLREIAPASVTLDRPPVPAPSRGAAIKALARYFSGSGTEAEQFAEQALSAGESTMTEAQALRTLAERFGTLDSPKLRGLVGTMARDHLNELDAKVRAAGRLLRPLGEVSPPPVPSARERWDAEFLRIFSLAKSWNESLRALFSGGGSPEQTIAALAALQSAVGSAMAGPGM